MELLHCWYSWFTQCNAKILTICCGIMEIHEHLSACCQSWAPSLPFSLFAAYITPSVGQGRSCCQYRGHAECVCPIIPSSFSHTNTQSWSDSPLLLFPSGPVCSVKPSHLWQCVFVQWMNRCHSKHIFSIPSFIIVFFHRVFLTLLSSITFRSLAIQNAIVSRVTYSMQQGIAHA